jgi:hypothetical protein
MLPRSAVVRLASIVLLGLTSTACADYGWKSETFDLGVAADLRAVTSLGGSHLAAGESGTVVVLRDDGGVVVRDIGDRDLNAVSYGMVVGDGGFAATSDDDGLTWTALDLGVSADLHAIVDLGDYFAILGDDVVLLRQDDGTWTPLEPPEGEWGRLRAGKDDGYFQYLVGLEGIVWTNVEDPALASWGRESVGTTADLFAIGDGPETPDGESDTVVIAGSNGTLLTHTRWTWDWHRLETDTTADFIGYSSGILLTAEGEIMELEAIEQPWRARLVHLHDYPGALGLDASVDPVEREIVLVGADGLAARLWYEEQPPW